MKKLRRILATTFAILMLMSIVPLQSFAALSLINPEIKSVKFDEGVMISMKEIEKLHDVLNEDIIVLQNDRDPYASMPASGFYYDNLIVSFSNGKTVELDRLFDEIPSTTSYSGPKFNVSYEDCKPYATRRRRDEYERNYLCLRSDRSITRYNDE